MNYKRLGDFIEPCNEKNNGNNIKLLQGISNRKYFQKAKTNTIGVDLSKYRIVRTGQFAFNRATTRNGDRISIALRFKEDCIVSPSYRIFKSKDENILNSEYVMMWFKRPEFDRYARFKSHGSAHEFFDYDEMCDVTLPIPSIEKQRAIVKEYNIVTNRIKLNNQLNQKLEETAQALYKHWFVDFEFPVDLARDPNPSLRGTKQSAHRHPELDSGSHQISYKSSGGKMVYNEELDKEIPVGWSVESLSTLCNKIASGSTPKGGKDGYHNTGISFIRSMNVYDFSFKYKELAFIDDTQASKLRNVTIKSNDILFNITGASVARCCIVPSEVLPARINQHIMIIRTKPELAINYYILCNLCSQESKKQLVGVSESGSTRQAITKGDLQNFRILLPSNNILTNYENKVSKLFNNKNSQQSQTLQELQSLLLAKMTKVEIEKETMS